MWFESSGIWTKFAAVTINGNAGTTPIEPAIIVPPGWDDFWNTIDANGDELRLVGPDGVLLDYDVDNGSGGAFDKPNRLGRILVNAMTVPAVPCVVCCLLYYGSSSAQGSAAGTAGDAGEVGWIEMAHPGGPYVVGHQPAVPGNTLPQATFAKTVAEEADVWVGFGGLMKNWTPQNRSKLQENPYYCTQTVEDDAGGDEGGMYAINHIRFVFHPRSGWWVRHMVKAGTDGDVFTSSLVTRVISPIAAQNQVRAVLDTRIGWRVQNARLTS